MPQKRQKRDTSVIYDPFDRRKRVTRWVTLSIIFAIIGSLVLTLGPVQQLFM